MIVKRLAFKRHAGLPPRQGGGRLILKQLAFKRHAGLPPRQGGGRLRR
jgi:hypothetical protein